METNLDDCTGEKLAYCQGLLMQAGALDASFSPLYMKKNRPAWLLRVICRQEDAEALSRIIFRETTTIGIRRIPMERAVLSREVRSVETSLGTVEVKACSVGGEEKIYPEYESMAKIARERNLPLQQVYDTVKKESEER